MALTPEQIEELKNQLSSQIQHLPEDQREEAQEQIDELSPEALESMLKQQQAQAHSSPVQKGPPQSVFRMIIEGKIPSKKIDENKHALAVLDIRPISKGHTIIIPKEKVSQKEQLPTSALTLARKISKRIISKFKAQSCEIQTESKFGEQVINIIPVYDSPVSITSPRKESTESELDKIQKTLEVKKSRVIREKRAKAPKVLPTWKRRIP